MVQENKRLKIIELIGSFTLAGAEIFAADLSKGFLKNGHDVKLLSIFRSENEEKYFERVGMEVQKISSILIKEKFNSGLSAFIHTLKARKKLENIVENFHPDVIHTHTTYPDLLGKMIKKKYPNIRIVRTIHTTYDRFGKARRLIMAIEERILPTEDVTVFISQEVKKAFCKVIKTKKKNYRVIYDGIETNKFSLKTNNRERKIDKIIFIAMGRFIKEKGFDVLIKAFSNIKTNEEIVVKIAGDGSLKEELFALSKQCSNNMTKLDFVGNVSNVPQFMNQGDAFISTSVFEGFGMVLIEAMAAAKPIIVTSINPFLEILGIRKVSFNSLGFQVINQGILFMKDDHKALANAVEYFLENKHLWKNFAENSLSTAMKFDIVKGGILKAYENLFYS
jgi:glycosyltransferase involved in cell wall biosynthesis